MSKQTETRKKRLGNATPTIRQDCTFTEETCRGKDVAAASCCTRGECRALARGTKQERVLQVNKWQGFLCHDQKRHLASLGFFGKQWLLRVRCCHGRAGWFARPIRLLDEPELSFLFDALAAFSSSFDHSLF